tara:strand:+ start:962 stop:1483 length:522 start_codon:yes stop_codon:yes gene_type:complete
MRLILFLILFPSLVYANDRVNYLTAIMPNMITYITDITDLEYKGYPLPTIIIEDEQSICTGAYERIEVECDIAGYYNDDTNVIYIRDTPTRYMSEDRFQEVILVHELVHFLQKFMGRYQEVECQQQLEELAYIVQDTYIDLHGIDEKNKIDPLFAIISSICPNKYPLFFHEEQ